MRNGDKVVIPYSEKVMDYVDSHSNVELNWSFDDSKIKYICYAHGDNIDTFYSDTFVEYPKNNVSDQTFWTYDEGKDNYVGKDKNGKLVKSIPKYHLEDEESVTSQKSDTNKTDSDSLINKNEDDELNTRTPDIEDESTVSDEESITDGKAEQEGAVAADIQSDTVSSEPDKAGEAAEQSNGGNAAVTTVLVIIGILIAVGLGIIAYMMIKKRKSEDGNEK